MFTRVSRLVAAILLVLMLALLCAACAEDDKYDSVNATVTAKADKTDITLYQDDTLVTYTVTVPRQCIKVSIQLLAGTIGEDGAPATLGEKSFTPESDGVTVVEQGAESVWTIPCDFGTCGMDGVRVEAQIPMGKTLDLLFTTVDVTASYPVHDARSILDAYADFVLQNADAPYYFICAPKDEALVKGGPGAWLVDATSYELSALITIVSDPDFLYPATATPIVETSSRTGDMARMLVPEGYVLCSIYVPNDEFDVCYTGRGMRVSDSARALLMARAGMEADEMLYPVAALIQQKAEALYADWDNTEAPDLDRLTWVYNRIYNEGLMALALNEQDTMTEAELAYYQQTAYGLFASYGGNSQGYADAFYVLCNLADIPCIKLPCEIIGDTTEGWINSVLLDGEWYIVDVYTAAITAARGLDMYARFCLNEEQAKTFYVWDAPGLTISDSTQFNKIAAPAGTTRGG